MSKEIINLKNGIKVKAEESFPKNSNPFHHDLDRMGAQLNDRFVAMYFTFDGEGERGNNIVLVDTVTGKRATVSFDVIEK
jgi:hypothetical protein